MLKHTHTTLFLLSHEASRAFTPFLLSSATLGSISRLKSKICCSILSRKYPPLPWFLSHNCVCPVKPQLWKMPTICSQNLFYAFIGAGRYWWRNHPVEAGWFHLKTQRWNRHSIMPCSLTMFLKQACFSYSLKDGYCPLSSNISHPHSSSADDFISYFTEILEVIL